MSQAAIFDCQYVLPSTGLVSGPPPASPPPVKWISDRFQPIESVNSVPTSQSKPIGGHFEFSFPSFSSFSSSSSLSVPRMSFDWFHQIGADSDVAVVAVVAVVAASDLYLTLPYFFFLPCHPRRFLHFDEWFISSTSVLTFSHEHGVNCTHVSVTEFGEFLFSFWPDVRFGLGSPPISVLLSNQ